MFVVCELLTIREKCLNAGGGVHTYTFSCFLLLAPIEGDESRSILSREAENLFRVFLFSFFF